MEKTIIEESRQGPLLLPTKISLNSIQKSWDSIFNNM
ncbi:hypothetical protein ACFX2H_023482 [Malus domestica]